MKSLENTRKFDISGKHVVHSTRDLFGTRLTEDIFF